jgi:hypothetical protein
MSKSVYFFVTPNDLAPILESFDSTNHVKYYRTGLRSKEELMAFNSIPDQNVGLAPFGDKNQCPMYLMVPKTQVVNFREINLYSGETKFAVDQKINPSSIVLRPGGIFTSADAIIEGTCGTIHSDAESLELFKSFTKQLRTHSKKVGYCYVGKEALEYFSKGWRLTQNISSPKEYDLQVP